MALAQETPVYRVNGRITERNIQGLEAFLANSAGEVFALKIRVPKNDGSLTTVLDGGRLSIFRTVSKAEFEITANEGFTIDEGDFVFDGFFAVQPTAMHQGITPLSLSPDKAADALADDFKVVNLQASRLNPNIRN